MRNIAIIDETFDINITSSYHIAIQASSLGITFAILDTVRVKFIAFKNIVFGESLQDEALFEKLDTLFHTEGFLNKNYKRLYFNFLSARASLVPSPIFDKEDQQSYLDFLDSPNSSDIVLSTSLPSVEAYLVYSLPERIYNLANHYLDTPVFYHQACPLIENSLMSSKSKSAGNRIYIQINPDFADAVIVEGGSLKLYNTFPYKTDKDLIFYILYLFDQFRLPIPNTPLVLSGYTSPKLVNQLKQYIRHVDHQEFNRSFTYSYTFNELIQHEYTNLINLFRCE